MDQARFKDFVLLRQRPGKALRGHGHYVGNLSAFGRAGAAMAHGSVLDTKKAHSSHIHWPKSKVAVVVGGTAIAGAALGAMLWMPFLGTASSGTVAPSTAVHTTEAETNPTSRAAAILPVNDDHEPQNQPANENENENENEIDKLNYQIASLENEVEALTGETFELNSELFQLELQLQRLEGQSTETRVVYNFVNVPLGKAVESVATPIPAVDLPESTLADSYSNDPIPEVVLMQEITYDSDNGFHLNSQFSADEYADSEEPVTSDDHRRIVYPPISSE